ncbi:hypothetical protein ACS0TY_005699 [Phlomoides rotata]
MDISQVTNSKVCMVFDGLSGTNYLETVIFILDLKSVGSTSVDEMVVKEMVPTVRFSWESFSQPAVCVLGSKLYVFELISELLRHSIRIRMARQCLLINCRREFPT